MDPREAPGRPLTPSSRSSSIAVGSTSEEALYAAADRSPSQPGLRDPADDDSGSPPGSQPDSTAATGLPGSYVSYRESGSSRSSSNPFEFTADMSNYPASMTSSIRAHVYEGGLRYHAFRDGKYAFPNDDIEQNRDDMKHTMTLMLCHGRHFYAPVEKMLEYGGLCLDLGTGTGIWAIELADRYPEAKITGLDLSPIQPNYVPENVEFFVDDFEEEWVDDENKYDYIHIRHTLHSVRDHNALLQRAYKHLRPGGYVEFQELLFSPQCDDGSMRPDKPYAFRDFMRYMHDGLRALGSDLTGIASLPGEVKAAGFEDVEVITHKCPIGVWPRDKRMRLCGLFLRTAIMDGLRGLSRRPFGTGLGWTQLQIEMFLIEVRKAVMDSSFHVYFPFHVVHGRKPLS